MRGCTSHWFKWAGGGVGGGGTFAATYTHACMLTQCHIIAVIDLLLCREMNRAKLPGLEWGKNGTLSTCCQLLWKCWQSERRRWTMGVLSPPLSPLWIWILPMFGEPEAASLILGCWEAQWEGWLFNSSACSHKDVFDFHPYEDVWSLILNKKDLLWVNVSLS